MIVTRPVKAPVVQAPKFEMPRIQQAMYNDSLSFSKLQVFSPRQTGVTTTMCFIAIMNAFKVHGSKILLLQPNQTLCRYSKHLIEDMILTILKINNKDPAKCWLTTADSRPNFISFTNSSKIQIEHIEPFTTQSRHKGSTFDLALIENLDTKDESHVDQLVSDFRMRNARMVITNPYHKKEYEDFVRHDIR